MTIPEAAIWFLVVALLLSNICWFIQYRLTTDRLKESRDFWKQRSEYWWTMSSFYNCKDKD